MSTMTYNAKPAATMIINKEAPICPAPERVVVVDAEPSEDPDPLAAAAPEVIDKIALADDPKDCATPANPDPLAMFDAPARIDAAAPLATTPVCVTLPLPAAAEAAAAIVGNASAERVPRFNPLTETVCVGNEEVEDRVLLEHVSHNSIVKYGEY